MVTMVTGPILIDYRTFSLYFSVSILLIPTNKCVFANINSEQQMLSISE